MDSPTAEEIARARLLLGRRVWFHHEPEIEPGHLVTRITDEGLVELEGWSGQFAPHLFYAPSLFERRRGD
jgi:hypothetical protein